MADTEYDEYPMDEFWNDPKYIAYLEEVQKRHDEGRDYPISDPLHCPNCGVDRICTGLGPVTNRADPTQTYELECGHLTI